MSYDLPTSVFVGDTEHEIMSDYRAVLDICAALSDAELTQQEKAFVSLRIFYPNLHEMPVECYEEAVRKCFWFINGGDETDSRHAPKLIDWKQDFPRIVAPVNRIIGQEIRSMPFLHWWTFLSAFYEVGDCTFAQIVHIRSFLAKGKPLSKEDREWYREHRELVDFETTYTDAEQKLLAQWGGA